MSSAMQESYPPAKPGLEAAVYLYSEGGLRGSSHHSLLNGPPRQLVCLTQRLPVHIWSHRRLLWDGCSPQLCPAPTPLNDPR